jgi:exonuclease VII small subunit
LENISQNFEKSINELKELVEKINADKESLKLKIQNAFTKMRNLLNEREDELLLEIDNKYNDLFFKI